MRQPPPDAVVEAVRSDLLNRSRVGLLKYGTGLDTAGLIADGFKPVCLQTWQQRLADAPERTRLQAAAKKVAAAALA